MLIVYYKSPICYKWICKKNQPRDSKDFRVRSYNRHTKEARTYGLTVSRRNYAAG